MKKIAAISLLVVAAACSKSETVSTDTAQSSTGVSASSTAATATSGTITPGTSSAQPTATETVAPAPPANVATAPGQPSATTASAPPHVSTATPNTTTAPASAPHVDAAPAPTQNIAAGQPIYKSKCVACHGADGKKPMKGVVLTSAAIQNGSDADLERGFRAGAQHKSTALSDEQLRDVIAYVKALK